MAIQYHHPLDRTFHALGDASRRQMLAMLAKRPDCTAGQLGQPFGFSQPTISKHIKVLEKAGLIERHVDGRVHRFRLVPEPLGQAEEWIVRYRQFWERAFDQLANYLHGADK